VELHPPPGLPPLRKGRDLSRCLDSHRGAELSRSPSSALLPPRLLEHLLPVPIQKLRARQVLPALRRDQRGAVVRQQFGAGGVAADGVAAEDDLVVLRQHGEGAQVEDLVVQRAERETVGHHVRPAGLEPLDVRRFEADDVRAQAQVVPAHAAAVLVGEQHLLAKGGIAAADFFPLLGLGGAG
jgi:hypothetical protein